MCKVSRLHWVSVLSLSFFAFAHAGCDGEAKPGATKPKAAHQEADGRDPTAEKHAEEGPHHGHLIELGAEEFHAELTHDDASKTVTVYLLDKQAKAAVSIADPEILLNLTVDGKPLQVKLVAAPQKGDPEGESSRFAITDESVLEALEAPKTTGRLNVTIEGKSYTGNVEHHEHGEHKH